MKTIKPGNNMTTIQYLRKNIFPRETFSKKLLPLLLCSSFLNAAYSQADKRLVLADQYFAAGEYFTAAGLYEQFLHPAVKQKTTSDFPLNSKKNRTGRTGENRNKIDIQFKQAESYRLSHYWTEASALYKECFEKDPAKYSAALYWFAVCERSIGNYAIAEKNIDSFLEDFAAGSMYQKVAEKEKATLEFIKAQVSRPDSVLYRVQKIETASKKDRGVFALSASNEGSIFITSAATDSFAATGINPNRNRLFESNFINNSLQHFKPVDMQNLDTTLNQGTASSSINGNYLYFTQWKKENGLTVASVYYATKKENGWGQPMALSSVNQQGYNSKQPFCSADGKYLFFASDRAGGIGGFDIWFAPLQTDGSIGEPVNAGAVINTVENEQAPFYHNASGTLVFASDRAPGMGGYDLFSAQGKETTWNAPVNMGYPVNSSRDDIYFSASEKESILQRAVFSSDRGAECCMAAYTVSKSPKKKIVTGIVNDCKNNEPLGGAEVTMKDVSGNTWREITGDDGKYSFEMTGNADQYEVIISKEKYNNKTAAVSIEGSNEKGWLIDTLYNTALCVEKTFVLKIENVVTVYFDFDQSQLKDRGMAQLDSIYNVLIEDTTATLQVSGYTDGRGSAEYNKILSDKRAKSCADYLIAKGIDAARITFESFGACCPVEMELLNGRDNPDGRSMNRRALINISKN